jgi:hypothetical protein
VTTRRQLSFWEFTKETARHATAEFFGPLLSTKQKRRRITVAHVSRDARGETSHMVDPGVVEREYVDRGREAVDRGRQQWEEFVERGKSLVGDQSSRVAGAVDAGRATYQTSKTRPSEGGGETTSAPRRAAD